MIAVIQRASEASVSIEEKLYSSIDLGLVVLLGIEEADHEEDVEWLVRKIINLRIFNDHNGVMNRSLLDVVGEMLVVSQFTLHASTKKGNRPSYIRAARPEVAIPMYEKFLSAVQRSISTTVQSGVFGANMQVALVNDGPVTILIDTKNKV